MKCSRLHYACVRVCVCGFMRVYIYVRGYVCMHVTEWSREQLPKEHAQTPPLFPARSTFIYFYVSELETNSEQIASLNRWALLSGRSIHYSLLIVRFLSFSQLIKDGVVPTDGGGQEKWIHKAPTETFSAAAWLPGIAFF